MTTILMKVTSNVRMYLGHCDSKPPPSVATEATVTLDTPMGTIELVIEYSLTHAISKILERVAVFGKGLPIISNTRKTGIKQRQTVLISNLVITGAVGGAAGGSAGVP
jgi:hypothetical protein